MTRLFGALVLSTVFAIAFAWQSNVAQADETKGSQNTAATLETLAEASQPGPEHKKLDPLVGQWTYSGKMWFDPNQSPIEMTGSIKRQWILGGRFVEEFVTGKGPDGKDFEGRGVVGYDKPHGRYTSGWISTMSTGISSGTGTYDADAKQFTFKTEGYCPLRKAEIQGRDVVRFVSDDKHVFEMYALVDGKEVKVMELTAQRGGEPRAAGREPSSVR
jgi:hypothetical protein